MIIDTHAHLMYEKFDEDIDEVVFRAKEVGVEKIINIGCSLEGGEKGIEMLEKYDCLYATLGLHPYDAEDISEELLDNWKILFKGNSRLVAVGETGLDYFKSPVPVQKQKLSFEMQLKLAEELKLPVVVHNREADEDCLALIDKYDVKVVFHCFGSSLEYARKVWKRGHMTSFTGIITFPNAGELLDVVNEVPLDQFMVETDCPYLAPQSKRGKRNEPAYVVEVLEKVAEVKGCDFEELKKVASENSIKFFNLNC